MKKRRRQLNLLETIILGIIQGITEWLPISSTGHLKIAEHYMGERAPFAFDFILHIGTLIVVLIFFRKDVQSILSALVHLDFKTESGKFIPLLIAATIPAAAVALIIIKYFLDLSGNILYIATAFILIGIILYATKTGKETEDISYKTAIIVGIAEGIAIIPGISRSGITIAVAVLLGAKREKAFQFSFLLSIPSVIGAIGYMFYTESDKLVTAQLGWTEIFAGVIAAMVVGYFAIKLLWKILAKKKLYLFAFYCWLLGTVLILLNLSGF
ncbi:undecaprenyl-diphosphate phosphatase [Candidatus Bathyarchaeota archaeon]|nr:undecaprenyl-diphosphate phosphatase [Candidatus Bathyarchaeota archaeon]